MSIIAIIPARGGSKGIPQKNITPVCGRPLIEWSIKHAKESTKINGVIVTTDSHAIAEVAINAGAEVFWRSPETATDTATSESAIEEVVVKLGLQNDLIVFLQATSPVRLATDIDGALATLRLDDATSLFSARRVEGYVWQEAGDLLWQRESRRPRQQRGIINLEENGSFYVFAANNLLQAHNRLHGQMMAFVQHPFCGYQVDEPSDIPIVEVCMRALACT